jgi:uncharacterized protein (DUF1800 family)
MADSNDIIHLLRRTEFIARPERVAALSAMTLADAVDDVMNIALNGTPVVPDSLVAGAMGGNTTQRNAIIHWWFDQMATRPRPFMEKLTLFWHGHFVTEWSDTGRADVMMEQNHLFRTMALGNFRTLTQAVSLQPAMIFYLTNNSNVKSSPNENFARELLELFTLGVGNYTQDDVAAAARAWTGHSARFDTPTSTYKYVFWPGNHDTGTKTFFGTTKNWDGPDIVDEILRDNAGKQLIAAKYIAKKLWEFLAYPKPAQNIVDDLAAVFVAGGMELRPLVRALLIRTEFYSTAAKTGLVRTPVEWSTALLAHTGLTAAAVNLQSYGARMGQTLFDPPNVAGWKNNRYWLTTGMVSGRASLAKRVASLLRANSGFNQLYTMTPADAVTFVADHLGCSPLTTRTRDLLTAAFLAERTASGGGNSASVTNLLVSMMLSGEMQVPSS